MSDFAIHRTAEIIGEADSRLSMIAVGRSKNARRATGYGDRLWGRPYGAVIDKSEPLDCIAAEENLSHMIGFTESVHSGIF